jgi:hypothetical protein
LKSKKVENIEVKEVSGPPTLQAPKGRSTPAEGAALGIRDSGFGNKNSEKLDGNISKSKKTTNIEVREVTEFSPTQAPQGRHLNNPGIHLGEQEGITAHLPHLQPYTK